MRGLVAICAVLTATSCLAIHWKDDGPHAFYYSGANCKFTVACGADRSETGISAIKVMCNGTELVNDAIGPKDIPWRTAGRTVTFDSSHFANGTTITWTSKAKVRLATGKDSDWFDGPTWSASAVNKFSLAVNTLAPFDLLVNGSTYGQAIASLATQNMGKMNYAKGPALPEKGWSGKSFLASLAGSNVAIISTHGSANSAAMEDGLQDWSTITPAGILSYRTKQLGVGQPPLNSSGNPPLNLFMMLACRQGIFQDWSNALYTPYFDSKNQAVVGFIPFINLSCSVAMSTTFLEYLQEGWPVATANVGLVDSYGPQTQNIKLVSDTVGPDGMAGTGLRYLDVTDMAIYGDPHTRLHNVYIDDLTQSTTWFHL